MEISFEFTSRFALRCRLILLGLTLLQNTREAAKAISGMSLKKAVRFLEDVKEKKQCVPFRRYHGGVGRCAQAKVWGTDLGRWPKKSAEHLLNLLRNAENNAEVRMCMKCIKQRPNRRFFTGQRPRR